MADADDLVAAAEAKLEETKRLVAAKKLRWARALADPAADDPPASELAAIKKLETQIANEEQYLRLRKLHVSRRAVATAAKRVRKRSV